MNKHIPKNFLNDAQNLREKEKNAIHMYQRVVLFTFSKYDSP